MVTKKMGLLIFIFFFLLNRGFSQIKKYDNWLEQVIRVNLILAPSLEYEHPLYKDLALTTKVGLLYAPSFGKPWDHAKPNYQFTGQYYYAVYPFANLDFKLLYDRNQRMKRGRHLEYNAGNFFALRTAYYYKPILTNHNTETGTMAYSIGPVWGLQRSWKLVHAAFDVGFPYCMDESGGNGTFCLKFNLNIGLNIKSWTRHWTRHNMEQVINDAKAKSEGEGQ